MTERTYRVYGFSSTHKVLAAEDTLKEADIPVRVIPRPASLGGAECGVAIRVVPEDADNTETILEQKGIVPAASVTITDLGA